MQVSSIGFNPTPIQPTTNYNKLSAHQNSFQSKIGEFPSYYCPNISFGHSISESIDFENDFYNTSNDIINNHLDKMELTKDLTKSQQQSFKKNLFSTDKPTLLNFFMDTKPSVLLAGKFPYFKNNDKYSFVRRTLKTPTRTSIVESPNIFILNNKLTKQTIDENKELYTKRMDLEPDTPTDEIYENLIGENSPLKQQHGYDDIIGITLGFSPINSILFQLEQNLPEKGSTRRSPILHANLVDKEFNSENSPYKDFSEDFKSNVQSSIDFIKKNSFKKEDLYPIGYSYIQLAPDEKFTQKLINNAQSNLKKAKEITE